MSKFGLYPENLPLVICYPVAVPSGIILSKQVVELIVKEKDLRSEFKDLTVENLVFQEADNFSVVTFKIIDNSEILLVKSKIDGIIIFSAVLSSEI